MDNNSKNEKPEYMKNEKFKHLSKGFIEYLPKRVLKKIKQWLSGNLMIH
ncbi:hypothetical protein M079_3453 [Bacteroides fragilis str. 3996 N(B) 6]|nr:hypothetical protein PARMER_01158 [Parabacteroides merdae ATCC 43184]EXY83407.1 hypothetical protein M079_3453 [Bacteroides fragilis str. 3996 N(B) 6]